MLLSFLGWLGLVFACWQSKFGRSAKSLFVCGISFFLLCTRWRLQKLSTREHPYRTYVSGWCSVKVYTVTGKNFM